MHKKSGRRGHYENQHMSAQWEKRKRRIALRFYGNVGMTLRELNSLGLPDGIGSLPGLNRVIQDKKARSLVHLARTTTLDEFLEYDRVGEGAANLFAHLLYETTKIHPNKWIYGKLKISTRKEKIRKMKMKDKKR